MLWLPTLFSNITLKLFWKALWPVCPWWRRWHGWDNCMGNLHVPHSKDFMSGIKHHTWTRLIDKGCTVKAQTCRWFHASGVGLPTDHTQWPVPGGDESWQPVENRESKCFDAGTCSSENGSWGGWVAGGREAARIQQHTGSCWESRISNYVLAGTSFHLLFHLQFFFCHVLFPALSSFYVTCQGYILNIFLPARVRNGLSELRSRFILQPADRKSVV